MIYNGINLLFLQALDGDFSEENRNRCRVATAPLIEAVENLTTFASNPEFASVPAQISREVRPRPAPTSVTSVNTPSLLGLHRALSFFLGHCRPGAHHPLCVLHAGQLHPPAQDSSLASHQSQRPAHLVCPRRSLSHRVGLHQESHHSHPVSRYHNENSFFFFTFERIP